MKTFKSIFIGLVLFCSIQTLLIAKHKTKMNDDYNEQLKTAIHKHQPVEIEFKKIINPTAVALDNPQELNQPIKRIASEDKSAKYTADRELRKILKDHAQGLLEGRIFTSKQALNFFNLNIHEQVDQIKKWLADHNTHQRDLLKTAQHDYHAKIAKFKAHDQQKALEAVQTIEDGIKTRNHKIVTHENKLQKLDEMSLQYQQKQEEISRLLQQNDIDQTSIENQLLPILEQLDELDVNFKEKCYKIIEEYQARNHQLLDTANNIVKSKKQSFALKTSEKKIKEASKPAPKPKALKNQAPPINPESVILSESIEALAKNPLLDTMFNQTLKDLTTTSKASELYSVLKKEKTYLEKAKHQRNMQQK